MYENNTKPTMDIMENNTVIVKESEDIVTRTRTLDVITNEIKECKNQIKQDFIRLGTLLNEAKDVYGTHGNWGAWLKGNFELSQTTATRLMNISREFANSPALQNLGLSRTKADVLIKLNKVERKIFTENNDISKMSTRELAESIRKYQGVETKKVKFDLPKSKKMNFNSISDVQISIDELGENIKELIDYFLEHSDNAEIYDISFGLRNICSEAMENLPPKFE